MASAVASHSSTEEQLPQHLNHVLVYRLVLRVLLSLCVTAVPLCGSVWLNTWCPMELGTRASVIEPMMYDAFSGIVLHG